MEDKEIWIPLQTSRRRFGSPSEPYASLRVLTGSFRAPLRGSLQGYGAS